MRNLLLLKSFYRDQPLPASAKQLIGRDLKKIRYSDEHFDGRLYVVVFPIGDTLLGYVHTSGEQAFEGCKTLTNITFPNTVQGISRLAFHDCDALKRITFPSSAVGIGEYAFYSCDALTGVHFSLECSITRIRNDTFAGCNNLDSINIPDTVIEIEQNAFNGYKLTNLRMSPLSQLEQIGSGAFNSADFRTFYLPGKLHTISSAFGGIYACNFYYAGSAEDWKNLSVSDYDLQHYNKLYFYSAVEPPLNADGTAYDGYYWYYDENGEPAIWTLTATE